MSAGDRPPQLKSSEWRHCARYFLIALVLHGLVLFYPLTLDIDQLETTPPATVQVKLTEHVSAIEPAPPATAPKPSPAPSPQRGKSARTAQPVLTLAADPTSAPATFTVPALPVAPPTSAPPVAAPAPITAPRFDVAYLHNPLPEYPPVSRRRGEEGKVLLKVRVMPDGLPGSIEIERTSTFERLDNAARHVVTRWRFVPAKRGDEAVEASVIVPIVFRLEN
jgi:protein TonB